MAPSAITDITNIASGYISSNKHIFEQFVQAYYHHLPQAVAEKIPEASLAGIALHHFTLLKQHNGSVPKLAVFNPEPESHHFHSHHTLIQLVATNRPFLIDTLMMGLEEQGLTVHRFYNTILEVEGVGEDISSVRHAQESISGSPSHIVLLHCEIDLQDESALPAIHEALLDKLNSLDIIINDWQAMKDKLATVQQEIVNTPLPTDHHSKEEVLDFLEWIGDHNFIFMGFREYRFGKGDELELYSVGNSGLGVLRGQETDTRSESFHRLPNELKQLLIRPQAILLSKSGHIAPIHRPVYMDFLGIQKFDKEGKVIGEYRFLGLLTSRAYQTSVTQIPMLREKSQGVLARAGLVKNGHAYNKMVHIINTLPRDDLFQATIDELAPIVSGIANLQDKNELRLFTRTDHYQRFVSCFVYIPRHKFDTDLRIKIQEILVEAFGGVSSGFTTDFNELHHARVHIHVRTIPGQVKAVDVKALEERLTKLMQDWSDDYLKALTQALGETKANQLARDYLPFMPAAYRERFNVATAVADTQRLAQLGEDKPLIWHLYQSTGDNANEMNLKLYGLNDPATLSNVLPILENFGVSVLSAQTYAFNREPKSWLQEYRLRLNKGEAVDLALVRAQFETALNEIWLGKVESDKLNELILTTKLDTYDVVVLRALSRYMVQAKAPFSNDYIHQTLVNNHELAVLLVELFHAKMSPDTKERVSAIDTVQAQINTRLAQVVSLDEDRIIRWFLDLLAAMLRTNFYQVDANGDRKDRLSFKFAANQIPNLPKPKPMFEIYVYSPRVEGVHLRGGKVARGGLRWSDRMEDYRTEVLGLVKAQMVKNAVIVPVGSKGGFIAKDKSKQADRETWQKEGVACYQTYIRGLLDVTDNLVDGKIIPPAHTVRHDEDDPYLVVAADKGTASFSDIANALSAEYNFWLQDAFASGGSAGYDHKGMGITARGAWESVKRHFRLMGKDIQHKDTFTTVGIGDMSGDVFGNGMLLSKNNKLVAAFNHLHIFIDPTPDPATSFAERERLFKLPRSMWTDYNPALISQGGGVFNRSDKSIAISAEMKAVFDISEDSLTPNELLNRLLKAPVDLIWNGGIGTYIKASHEDHSDVGDRANDAIRVNGSEVRAKVVGEGGNLGCTQQGRIEYALNGGRIYTDAIDNSGGVNCSDHEVNIKILLGSVVERGDMTTKQRNDLLERMTDTVAQLVLRQNYLQPEAIELSSYEAVARLGEHARFMQFLENKGRLDRAIEYLPSEESIAQRQKASQGLTNPEFAVLLAYGKMWVYEEMLASDLPDDAYFLDELKKYFPQELGDTFFAEMKSHRLHREIICTYLTNGLVNRLGIENVFHLYDEAGRSIADITRSYALARDMFGIQGMWNRLEALDNVVSANVQLALEVQIRQALKAGMLWLLNNPINDVAQFTTAFKNAVKVLISDTALSVYFDNDIQKTTEALTNQHVPADDALAFARLPLLVNALDVVHLANQQALAVADVAQAYFGVVDALQINALKAQIGALPSNTYWDRRAVGALSQELKRTKLALVADVLALGGHDAINNWQKLHEVKLAKLQTQLAEVRSVGSLASLSVLLSEINGLKQST
ncbi:MAG: NAD-glutamate dehydrogenase [Moraxella sp.]|nr:NAD-glutamate dehydrogenase [Moraxella sp.]